MPASLTVQVRLGFSMGWRIWTPNEVGFYAKTLAHSYFILVILKAKFLKQKIWIVNYNLFMGVKRYFVFIEYLHFGKKSLEEGCFWKKITFTSLVARHSRYTKEYFKRKVGVFFKIASKSRMLGNSSEVRWRPIIWNTFQIRTMRKLLPQLKPAHDSHYLLMSNRAKIAKLPKVVKTKFKINSNLNTVKDVMGLRARYFLNVVIFSKKKNIRLRNVINKSVTKKYLKLLNSIKTQKKKQKSLKKKEKLTKKNKKINTDLSFKISADKLKNKMSSVYGPIFVNKSYAKPNKSKKVVNFKFPRNYEKYNISKYRDFSDKKILHAMLEEFRFDPVYINDKYSVAGGPRKRLSRNLRRAFKAKFIKNVTNLIWFWEKVSRLVTYYVHSYLLEKKNII